MIVLIFSTLTTALLAEPKHSIIIQEEAQTMWQELTKKGLPLETEPGAMNAANVLEMAQNIIKHPDTSPKILNRGDEYTLEKRTVNVQWLRSETWDCSKIERLIVGQKRFVAYMPICYRWRTYDKEEGQCRYIAGGDDPGTPMAIIADQAKSFMNEQYALIAIQTTEYVCLRN